MGRLELRFEKRHLDSDLNLGVVARIRQIKDADGNFPSDPQEQEVVIPAGSQAMKMLDGLPLGTYRIEARLPSGQVLRETRQMTDIQQSATVVFDAGYSPHEWLGWQRLAGNVPSQDQYEDWLNKIARQIGEVAKAKAAAGKPIKIDQTTIQKWARLLREFHLKVHPLLKSAVDLIERATTGVSDLSAKGELEAGPPLRAPPVSPRPAEFEILQIDPLRVGELWDAVASLPAWTVWREAARDDNRYAFNRFDDRQVTLWQITQRDRSGSMAKAPSGRDVPLRYLAVMQRGDGVDVIQLPVPWPLSLNLPPAKLEILRQAGTSESGRTMLSVRDELVGSLIMYLNNGQMADAATVLAEANRNGLVRELIYKKLENPFAACAAAYVGLATMSGADKPEWTAWLVNLMNWFEWLPDGAIVHAAYLLKTAQTREDLSAALAAFKEAYRRGIPFYTAGLQHLANGLYTFSERDAEAKAMCDKVSTIATRVDPNGAFTQITIFAPRSQT